MNFNDFYWHDATIENIQIDRSDPGSKDEIVFEVEWPEKQGKTFFVFNEVYWAIMKLNFGIVARETILDATELENDQDIDILYSKWGGALNNVKLGSYRFQLNSTGGEIKIIAKGFREDKL